MEWKKGPKIGAGSYGSVYQAQDCSTGRLFAVKEAAIDDEANRRAVSQLQMEISILSSLKHPNIVSYLGCDVDDGHLYIFLEYMPGGSLANVLSQYGALEGNQLRTAVLGCLQGLDYLHSCSPPVVHRDVKCANVLVDASFCVKLADFGCSKCKNFTKSFTAVGSIPWMAPEVIQQKDGYGRKADIWSFGCTALEMATAEKPWGGEVLCNAVFAMSHIALTSDLPNIPDSVPGWCRELIQLCVRRAVDERPKAEQLLTFVASRPEDWRKGPKIGAGSYGLVYQAQECSTGRLFAVKEAAIDDEANRRAVNRLQMEISILSSLKHPNIVSYLGCDVDDGHLYIFLEYMPGGSLANVLSQYGALEGHRLRTAVLGCLQGLDYLHSCSPPVVHRDVKCANVLVDTSFCVKLADFGCSKQSSGTTSFTTIGSIPWMAPEVIQQQDGYGRKADIWSFGCTVLEMATAEKPWGNRMFSNAMFALYHIVSSSALPNIPDSVPGGCRELIRLCVCRAAGERPSTQELLVRGFLEAAEC